MIHFIAKYKSQHQRITHFTITPRNVSLMKQVNLNGNHLSHGRVVERNEFVCQSTSPDPIGLSFFNSFYFIFILLKNRFAIKTDMSFFCIDKELKLTTKYLEVYFHRRDSAAFHVSEIRQLLIVISTTV